MNIDEAFGKVPTPLLPAPILIDSSQLTVDRDGVIVRMKSLSIVDAASYDIVVAFLVDEIKPMQDLIHESCDPLCDATNKAHKAATGQRRELLAPLDEAAEIGKEMVGEWNLEQDRLRQIEEARIEQVRQDEEAARQKEAAAAEAADQKVKAEALAKAEALEASGDAEGAAAALEEATKSEAQTLIQEPFVQPPPVANPALQKSKTKGASTRFTYAVEVTSLREFLQGIIDKKIPPSVITVDFGKMNQQANAMDGVLDYPGTRMTRKPITSIRRKK